ncbi:MAG TPA: hypothetical protein DCO79_08345 [Spirochaeta sp.]|nr:hypothetical protein [Spirochaeta sp.]
MLGRKKHSSILETIGRILELEKVQFEIIYFDDSTEKKLTGALKDAELFFMIPESLTGKEISREEECGLCLLEAIAVGYMIAHKGRILFFGTDPSMFNDIFYGEPVAGSIGEALSYFRREKKIFESNKKLLEARGIISEAQLSFSGRGFIEAVENGMQNETQAFLDAGFSTETETPEGVPLLNIAVRNGNLELCRLLMSYDASLNIIARDRCSSPVMDAVTAVKPEIAEILIDGGADLNFKNRNGQSALIVAIGARMDDIANLLIEKGADITLKDSLGMTAGQYAKMFSLTEIYEKLESKL